MSSRPSPPHTSSSAKRDDDGIGFSFYARLAGIVVVAGVVAMIVMLVFFRAVYAWGILGALIVFSLLLLGAGWVLDRRSTRRRPPA
jgi:lipoprotein signal peptidase